MLPKSKKYWSLRYFFKRHQLSYGHCVTRSLRTNCDGLSTATWNDTRKTNTSKFLKLIQILFLIGAKKRKTVTTPRRGIRDHVPSYMFFPFNNVFKTRTLLMLVFIFHSDLFYNSTTFYWIITKHYAKRPRLPI